MHACDRASQRRCDAPAASFWAASSLVMSAKNHSSISTESSLLYYTHTRTLKYKITTRNSNPTSRQVYSSITYLFDEFLINDATVVSRLRCNPQPPITHVIVHEEHFTFLKAAQHNTTWHSIHVSKQHSIRGNCCGTSMQNKNIFLARF